MFLGLPYPDPLVRGMDPKIRIRIRTKMSQISNTGSSVRLQYGSVSVFQYLMYNTVISLKRPKRTKKSPLVPPCQEISYTVSMCPSEIIDIKF
jgi:hypothetical protein